MKITRIAARGLLAGVDFDLPLPDRGVVLLTGDNGVGKSTVVECVALAVWGRPHRGEPCWGERSEALAVVDGRELRRERRGRSTTMRVDGQKLDTATKTQALVLLDVDVWRRACSFNGEDRATFLRGGPVDRERVLESILGLDGFDAAAQKARAALREAEGRAREAILRQEDADRAAERALARFQAELQRARAPAGPPPKAPPDLGPPTEAHRLATEAATEAARRRAVAAARLGEELGRHLGEDSTCPRCLQPVPPEHQDLLAERLEAAQEEEEAARHAEACATASRDQAWRAYQAARENAAQARADSERATAELRDRAGASTRAVEAEAEASEAEERREALAASLEAARCQEHEMRAAEQVVTGLRRDLLQDALTTLEDLVRPGVDDFLPGAALTFPEFKVSVTGVGGGTLGALSTGQRRRLEVVTTLALGQLAEMLAGWVSSTLFLDEVLDGLDSEGKRAAKRAATRAAEDRCVVVITHDEDLRRDLDYVAWYHVGPAGLERRA